MSLIVRLRKKFIQEGVEINSPSSDLEVEAFEKKYGKKLPDILREYFLEFNGTGEGICGDNGFAFFSLAEFILASEKLENIHPDRHSYPDCFVFSDYLAWCWGYAVQLDGEGLDGPVFMVCGGYPAPRRVAESFSQFVWLYLKDHHELV